MNAIENFTAAAMAYAGLWASWRTWRWALRPEVQPEPESPLIPWSEVAAPNVFPPRRPVPRKRQMSRQARLSALSARCEDIRRRLERGIQAAWREQTRTGRKRMRALEARLAVVEERAERLRLAALDSGVAPSQNIPVSRHWTLGR
jgi:hypothetical protein